MIDDAAADAWLNAEDAACHQDRVNRLQWLADKMPDAQYWMFPGGFAAKSLFEETRYCFVYGQFLATIVLGFSYIEQTLASLFYGAGRDDLERASISILLDEALKHNWIDQQQFNNLQHARKIRNSVTHFRRPGRPDTVVIRSVVDDEAPYALFEDDARHVMALVLHLLGRRSV